MIRFSVPYSRERGFYFIYKSLIIPLEGFDALLNAFLTRFASFSPCFAILLIICFVFNILFVDIVTLTAVPLNKVYPNSISPLWLILIYLLPDAKRKEPCNSLQISLTM